MSACTPPSDRRRFFRQGARWAAAAGSLPALATAPARAAPAERMLALSHTHTGERLQLVYAQADRYLPEALGSLNHFLRDHYSGEVGLIDPRLFDLLHRLRSVLGSSDSFEVISGYRCPTTNQRLRQTRGGGVASHSLHMDGRAIDLRLRGVPLAELRDAALSLRAGGVGFYPREQFVHIDTGRVRSW
ncbi:MAG: DUF882 domain-containing protein [Burkholderiaceae bacterium]|nr:DUF882 domain-containing protein [Burkholderiaceae bacterium]